MFRAGAPRPCSRAGAAACGRPAIWSSWSTAAAADPDFDIDLVPVAIYLGPRSAEGGEPVAAAVHRGLGAVGRFRKLLNVLFNGRNSVVYFGEPIRLRDAIGDLPPTRSVRRLLRALRAEFRAQRASTIGPDLSHRRTMVAHILRTQAVRHAVRREMQARAAPAQNVRGRARRRQLRRARRRAVLRTARKYAMEIAANYSQPFVTFMAALLGRLWTRLYDGVEFEHVEKLHEIGDGAEIIYVPCHRSHMDYLLLSYVIYRKGFAVPHVAAGVNLDMPVIGHFLRKGGAFFMRRSFKGEVLYGAVFTQYLGFMMARGHPLEYFIEGGRSRTGRMLAPRTGMLSMTLRSYLREPNRPVVFMPVYFGYERIVEGRTYIGELSGKPEGKGERSRRAQVLCPCCAASSARCTSTWASPSCSMRLLRQVQSALARIARRRRAAEEERRRPVGSARRSAIWRRASPAGSTPPPP